MPLNAEKIRAICFDVDGTLSDTDDVMVARFSRLLKALFRVSKAGTHPHCPTFCYGGRDPGKFSYGRP